MPRPDARIIRTQHEVAAEAQAYVARNIEELLRRSRFNARDGYPASSMGGSGGGSDVGRPTERAAIADPIDHPSLVGFHRPLHEQVLSGHPRRLRRRAPLQG